MDQEKRTHIFEAFAYSWLFECEQDLFCSTGKNARTSPDFLNDNARRKHMVPLKPLQPRGIFYHHQVDQIYINNQYSSTKWIS